MIQMQTMLNVADNSGARRICCISPLGGDTGRGAGLGASFEEWKRFRRKMT